MTVQPLPPGHTKRRAPDLSPAERARLERIEAAPAVDIAADVAVEAITQDWMLERHRRQVAEMERDMLRAQIAALKSDSSGGDVR